MALVLPQDLVWEQSHGRHPPGREMHAWPHPLEMLCVSTFVPSVGGGRNPGGREVKEVSHASQLCAAALDSRPHYLPLSLGSFPTSAPSRTL